MRKIYTKKSNAKRAAIAELGPEALEGIDFALTETDGAWTWATKPAKHGPTLEAPEAGVIEPPAPEQDRSEKQPDTQDAPSAEEQAEAPPAAEADPAASTPKPRKERTGTKQAELIAMLRRPDGATVDQIVAATGWQKHTVRGAISGALRKKLGLEVSSAKAEDGERVYRIG